MKKIYENTILSKIVIGLFALFSLFVPQTALAAPFLSQTTFDTISDDFGSNTLGACIAGSAIAGTLEYVQIAILTDASTVDMNVIEWTGSTCTSGFVATRATSVAPVSVTSGSLSFPSIEVDSSFSSWNASNYYSFTTNGSGETYLYGSVINSNITCRGSFCGALNEPYIILSDTVIPPPTPDDGITLGNPLTGDTEPTPTTFSGTYTNSSTYDQIVFNVFNLTDSNEQGYTFSISPINGVDIPYSFSIPLATLKNYEYQAWLRDSSTGDISDVTDFESFDIASGAVPTPPITPETCVPTEWFGFPVPDLACELRNLFIWAFIPDATVLNAFVELKTTFSSVFPFSYISDLVTIFDAGSGTAELLPTVNLDLTSSFGFSQEIVSQSSLENALPSGVNDFIKGLVTMALWVGVALYFYRRVLGLLNYTS